jgi:hypothetical protein
VAAHRGVVASLFIPAPQIANPQKQIRDHGNPWGSR